MFNSDGRLQACSIVTGDCKHVQYKSNILNVGRMFKKYSENKNVGGDKR